VSAPESSPGGASRFAPVRARATALITLSLAGVACALTLVFLAMRSVMNVGGFCAEGGPYEIHQHCPQGVPGVLIGSIWGGLILAGLYVVAAIRYKVPNLAFLLWPALFLSLGWNFFEYAFDPPGDTSGIVGGWLVCGILFALMGGLPLIVMVPSLWREFAHGPQDRPGWPLGFPAVHAKRVAARAAGTPATPWTGMVSELERLDELHRSGALNELEYRLAKQKLISDGRS
jgi:hypothetical protein